MVKTTSNFTPERLRDFRKARNLSRKQAAALVRVSVRTWEKWEMGETNCSGPASALLAHLEAIPAEKKQ